MRKIFSDDLFLCCAVKCVRRSNGCGTQFDQCGISHPGNVVEFDLARICAHFFDLICDGWVAVASDRSKNDKSEGEFKSANDAIETWVGLYPYGTT